MSRRLIYSLCLAGQVTGCEPPAAADAVSQRVSDSFSVRDSVNQLHIWNGPANAAYEVVDGQGDVTDWGESDELGSLVFRELPPATDVVVRLTDNPDDFTDQLRVLSVEESLPDELFYAAQVIEPGNGYLRTRDGTLLSYFVSLPGPVEDGPYPTLVNYSGYSPSRPGQSLGETAEVFCDVYPILCDAPDFASGVIAGVKGYAVVGVNLRGTGCSGGAYDYFEPLQLLDGYDVIEIVARQEWVAHGKVGMVGLSYPGISQLFVAQTQPPSLAAITPFSVIADTGSSTLVPGGIYNDGFALSWIEHVLDRAVPYGHGWIQDVVDAGDTICEENQLLHSQKLDVIAKSLDNPYYSDEVAKPLDPTAFAHEIQVPVFMTGQWQDEQTGPHFPALFDKFTSAPVTRFTATNGVHMDGFAPQIMGEWVNFLDLYVARQVPHVDPMLRILVPTFMQDTFGDPLLFPPNRFEDYTSYDEALADYEAEDSVRIIYETGTAEGVAAGAPEGSFEVGLSHWPPPDAVTTRYYLQPNGGLSEDLPPADGGVSFFEHDPEAGHRGSLASGSVNGLQPDWGYAQPAVGHALSFLTPPLEDDLVLTGHGSVDLWLRSDATDADLEVTISEVRPDGMESIIQSGWLRASHRVLRADATELRPVKSHYEEDISPIEPFEWTEVRVEIMPYGHVLRAGSQLRLVVDTPGDSMASWRFLLNAWDLPPVHEIAHHAVRPSSLVLSVLPGVAVPTELPPVNALRGQPFRVYEPLVHDEGDL